MTTPPVCNYEDSDYQTSFWDQGGRQYEDRAEAVALKRLLPKKGKLMLELGAGAGRNTPRYTGFERVVLLDYSRTQLEQAQRRLGDLDKYIFVAADIYRLPFVDRLFDGATMIRVLHHMADAPKTLSQIRNVLQPNAIFILEFANKLNFKAILRYWLGKQEWSPFTLEPVEFVELNFDFHPRAVKNWLKDLGFDIQRILSVSHFRMGFLKRIVPTSVLVFFDSLLQWSGKFWQLTPSIFVKSRLAAQSIDVDIPADHLKFFKCPDCGSSQLTFKQDHLLCSGCSSRWSYQGGIYDFRSAMQ